MAIDFSNMLDDDDDVATHPRDIFFTLERRPQFLFPRDIQTEVMNLWFEQRHNRDNVIKLNVGSGKTLVGLLILQSSLNENVGPALYVSPNNQLLEQVIHEASQLGIDVTEDPRDPEYFSGEKICVINVYKLFNGKSVFGVGASEINIGTVVFDDAHACISTISQQFRIILENGHTAFNEVLEILSEDLKGYSQARFLDIEARDPLAHMEVPFWSWNVHNEEILKVLHSHRDDEKLQFTFPFLKEILTLCRCVISGQRLEIEPCYPATDIIQSFRRARRRIYMTATLSDDSVIVTHFGVKRSLLTNPIVPDSSQSIGERMILMPQELNPDLTVDDVRELLCDLADNVNVVVIVPSRLVAEDWRHHADQILLGDDVGSGIENLRNNHVGLTVLINRYDGIDLPGDACRVLAIDGLPEVRSFSDMVDSEVLSGTTVNLRRQIERIEQGMGRGIRSIDDYCAVLLLGGKLIGRLRSKEGREMLTNATSAQLELSRRIARRLNNPSIDEIKSIINQCLNRDPNWITVSKRILLGQITDKELKLDPGKIAIREAYDYARKGQHNNAIDILDQAINSTSEEQLRAWLLAKKATFQFPIDPDNSQRTLAAAHDIEPRVLKPLRGDTYKKIKPATKEQAEQLISNHRKRFPNTTEMKLFADGLCSDLRFVVETSEKFETAINSLAWFIGVIGQRPEKEQKEGPDNLWMLPNGTALVIECKNGVVSNNGISKNDAGQLGQSVAWVKQRYPGSNSIPIIIHKDKTLGPGASPDIS